MHFCGFILQQEVEVLLDAMQQKLNISEELNYWKQLSTHTQMDVCIM